MSLFALQQDADVGGKALARSKYISDVKYKSLPHTGEYRNEMETSISW